MKIYTKTGDGGETALFGGGRVSKDNIRVAAYGDVDETNSSLGAAMACEPAGFEAALFESIQRDLFAIGGQLASPSPKKVAKALEKAAIPDTRVQELESAIDRAVAEVTPLTAFVLPGGSPKAAALHLTRTVCRRAERSVVTLDHAEGVPPIILVYLNRLSDLLFAMARLANHRANLPDHLVAVATHKFYQLDVFTRTPLKGNALAVFPDGRGLDTETMQALAREMNLSETTFVTPSNVATKKVRFFTPGTEVPLVGHPTIGTWWLLAEQKLIDVPANGDVELTQETKAGVFPVRVTMENGRPTRVVMTQASPQFGESVTEFAKLGKALGGDSKTVKRKPAPQVVSTGLPQMMIPVKSLEILRNLPSGGGGMTLGALLKHYGTDCAMCYTMETESADATVHCRMFAPGIGIMEDPATGSASGALGAYLVWHNVIRPHGGVANIVVEQGLEIGRASTIHVEITVGNGGEITDVRVGGEAVTVIEGEVRL